MSAMLFGNNEDGADENGCVALAIPKDEDGFFGNKDLKEVWFKLMSKLLNASDGLIQTKKKIIFTANLTHLDDVDSALIRPGRCFDALVFSGTQRSRSGSRGPRRWRSRS